MANITFEVGDILQDKFHVEANEGKFNPQMPTILVKGIIKEDRYACEIFEAKKSNFHKDYNPLIVGKPFSNCQALIEHFVKIF